MQGAVSPTASAAGSQPSLHAGGVPLERRTVDVHQPRGRSPDIGQVQRQAGGHAVRAAPGVIVRGSMLGYRKGSPSIAHTVQEPLTAEGAEDAEQSSRKRRRGRSNGFTTKERRRTNTHERRRTGHAVSTGASCEVCGGVGATHSDRSRRRTATVVMNSIHHGPRVARAPGPPFVFVDPFLRVRRGSRRLHLSRHSLSVTKYF